ncbi:MAG: MFS transporter [Acidimicrobiaceae bacterium]|nr:MFS transporter [Acidimicrobiaceae bacterium]MYL02598.1 MFS transporter [Acidimicrobiaceae bacterium]
MRKARPAGDSGRFAALHNPAFRKLFVGGLFTFLTMQVAGIARAWLAFELTGSNTGLGGVMLAFGACSIFAIPYGGMISDRFSKRNVLILAGALQAATPVWLGVAVATDTASYWMLLAASVVQGGVISILAPARLTMISEVVGRESITNAIFLSMSTVQMARVVGPAAAGALIGVALFGLAGVFFAAGVLGTLSVVLLIGLPRGAPSSPSGRTALGDIVDGVRFVRSRPDLVHLLGVSFGVVLVGFPHMAFLPIVAERVHDSGSTGFGLLNASAAVGAVIGSLALANLERRRLRAFQTRSAVAFGVSLAVFAVMPSFYAALAVIAIVGATSSVFQALNNSLLLTSTPVEYHGRVQSLLMLSFSGFAIAALPIGIVADAVGIRATLVGLGILVLLVMAAARLAQPRGLSEETTL